MSKAPEWIYLDGDVQAGDGMFPRCFEDPKYASDPPIEYGRIDLLEAAEQRGYANAMEAERKIHADRIEELEAKLAKAVIEMEKVDAYLTRLQTPNTEPLNSVNSCGSKKGRGQYTAMVRNEAREFWASLGNTLAELKGEK